MADIPAPEVHDAVIIDGCREAALASTCLLIEGESRAPRRSWEWIDHRHSDRHAHGYADLHAARHRVADARRADGDRLHVQSAVAISAHPRAGTCRRVAATVVRTVLDGCARHFSVTASWWSTGPSRRVRSCYATVSCLLLTLKVGEYVAIPSHRDHRVAPSRRR